MEGMNGRRPRSPRDKPAVSHSPAAQALPACPPPTPSLSKDFPASQNLQHLGPRSAGWPKTQNRDPGPQLAPAGQCLEGEPLGGLEAPLILLSSSLVAANLMLMAE